MEQTSTPRPGPLSPAFISSDDAARWAHQRIVERRTVEYGSVILQRLSAPLFVASEPVMGRSMSFDWTQLLDREGPSGEFLHPAGYRIVGSLHSHPDTLNSTQRQNPKWTQQQVKTFMSFYSTPDMSLNYVERARFSVAYLSGPDGALLKYQPSGSAAEAGFVQWLDSNGPWASPHAHDGSLEGVYTKLASVGQLTFLLSSPAWGGSVGRVPADWVPYAPFQAPVLTMPCGPVFSDKAGVLAYAASLVQRTPNARQRVLILKSDTGERYVTGEAQGVGEVGDQLPLLPVGFHVYGLYVLSRPLTGDYPGLEPWLYKNFISPLALAQHIAQFRQYSLGGQSTLGASLFVHLRDGALLRYRFSGSAAESALFTHDATGAVRDNGLQAQLRDGTLLARGFVHKVATAGELTVEKTSALWDRSGVVGADWSPYSRFALPSLSAAFLTADDAARYAHAQIDERREQRFGGMILRRQDGRFLVTEPVPAGPRPFSFNDLYPADRQNAPIIVHPGLSLHARYGSRLTLAMTDPAQAAQLKWSRQDAEVNGQMFHDRDVADLLASGLVGYLSAAPDSLIACQPSTTVASWRQQWQATSTDGESAMGKGLADGTKRPVDVVRTLAESGTLRVVIGNALWGPAGFVEADWEPGVRALQFQRPEVVSHGPMFESADAAASDLQGREPIDHGEHFVSNYFAFILKHDNSETYIASELIPQTRTSALLSLASLYGTTLPAGFSCHSLYYARQWAGNGSTAWLQRFFISPEDFSAAIAQARANARMPPRGAPLYIATPEGALLRYQSPSPQSLFEALSEADSLETVRGMLNIGTLAPLQFVRRVASSGRLSVVQPSGCWDRTGDVLGLWNPYQNLQRRRLSPAFLTMDDAARYVRRRVRAGVDAAYGGIILRRDDGWFFATEPLRVPDEMFDFKWIFPDEMVTRGLYPPRTAVAASYHARSALQSPFLLSPEQAAVYGNMFSTRLLAQALSSDPARDYHYLLAADGALIRLKARPELKYPVVTLSSLVARPRNRRDWLNGVLERQIRNGELSPAEYVRRVALSFDLQVVTGSAMWGARGPVAAWWSPYAPKAAADGAFVHARHEPACGALYTQADDAAHGVHRLVGVRDEVQFGFVLHSTSNAHCVATLPISDAGSHLSHRRVFNEAGYPQGFQVSGMYVCAARQAGFHPGGRPLDGDRLYQGLFSPVQLIEAMWQVHATQNRAALPLYLSCADGALLRFTVRNERFTRYGDEISLKLRLLSPRDYIRRMAAAGELRILVPSANWPGIGVVDAQWQPGRSRGTPPAGGNPWALGPVYTHRDDAAAFVHLNAGRFTGQQALGALLEKDSGFSNHVPVLAQADEGFPSAVAPLIFRAAQWPSGYQISAAHLVYHAGLDQPHVGIEASYCRYFVSWRELGFYLHQLKEQGLSISGVYLSTRDGALLSYLPTFSQAEYNLLDTTGKWTASSGYTAFAPAPSRFISELARIGQLQVIRSGEFWTARTRLHADLKLPGPRQRPTKDEL
ncbi:MAG: DUF4329 domain-containing protein [Pseudomonas sp.]|uniref:hypothetical protein n=1 Tax=Pseudomonas sp. TaxID=306 RepID=UPI003C76D6B5